jgi:hypothetical protein
MGDDYARYSRIIASGFQLAYFYTIITRPNWFRIYYHLYEIRSQSVQSENFALKGMVRPNLGGGRNENIIG